MIKEEIKLLWNASAMLIGASLPLILMGRAVSAVCISMGLILGLLSTRGASLRSTMYMLVGSKPFYFILAILAAFGLTSAFAIDSEYSLRYLYQLSGIALGGLLLFVVLREMPAKSVRLVVQTLSLTTILAIVLVLLDAFLGDPRLSLALHGDKAESVSRLNYMSSVLAVVCPFLWAWLLRKERDQEVLASWFSVPLVLISFWAVFVCGGRAGWVGAVVAAFIFLIVAGRKHDLVLHKKHWALGIVAAIAGPAFYGLAQGWDTMINRVNLVTEQGGAGSGRLPIWEFAIKHMSDNPLTGIGLNGFRKLDFTGLQLASEAHPHNFVIQLMLESGLIGSVICFAFILYVLKTFWSYAQYNIYGLASLCSLIAFFVSSLANTSIFHAWWLMFAVVTGVIGVRIGWGEGRYKR